MNSIWHPYTQHSLEETPLFVTRGEGAYLHLQNGQKILDAISSWWVNLHGHSHPQIAASVAHQAATLEHVVFAGFNHQPAQDLADILVSALQERKTDLTKVFYSDNGSTSVEVALKMAFQFHLHRGETRPRFLALKNSYHGDTLGAMAASEPEGFHAPFRILLPQVDFVAPGDEIGLKRLLRENKYAAMIVEPLIQGAAGMKTYVSEFLQLSFEECKKNGTLFICDEVFTGFHRTGRLFAFEESRISPDLICLSKGLTGGFLPLGATLATEEIYSIFLSKKVERAFLHGHSYTANPISCAAALASWKILNSQDCQNQIKRITQQTSERIGGLKNNRNIVDGRSLGTIGAIDLNLKATDYYSEIPRKIKNRALEKGVLLRPLGATLYAVPPYCTSESEIDKIYDVISELTEEYGEPK